MTIWVVSRYEDTPKDPFWIRPKMHQNGVLRWLLSQQQQQQYHERQNKTPRGWGGGGWGMDYGHWLWRGIWVGEYTKSPINMIRCGNMAPRVPQMGGMDTPTHTKTHKSKKKRGPTVFFEKNMTPKKSIRFLIKTTCPTHYNMHSFWRRLTRLTTPGWPYPDVPWSIRPPRIQIWSPKFSVTASSIFRTTANP